MRPPTKVMPRNEQGFIQLLGNLSFYVGDQRFGQRQVREAVRFLQKALDS